MKRQIIKIDREKCNGCGLCVRACHEGALELKDGKAVLVRDDYCDGLGNCLPACPQDAIAFEEREAAAYDERAVRRHGESWAKGFVQWPLQIKLVPAQAPWLENADIVIAATCTAFASPSFHGSIAKDRVLLIGCPKLDGCDYAEKLTEILARNDIRSVTVARMEVPCCGGLTRAVLTAVDRSGSKALVTIKTIATDGTLQV